MSRTDFLSRWSRRKREAAASPSDPASVPAIPGEAAPAAGEEGGAETDADRAAPPPVDVPELPALDALTAETDLAPFLRLGVPKPLRNAALRRMWSLDPSIRDYLSEAREYAYDWNVPGGVPGLGSLLPGDDVEAMLREIFGDAPEPRDPDAAPAGVRTSGLPPSGPPDEAPPPATGDEDREADRAGEAAAAATRGDDPAPLPPEPAPPPVASPERTEPASERSVPARVRRHGGAVPI